VITAEVNLELVAECGVRRHREDCGRVRADSLEDDEAEIDDAGHPELEVEREERDYVHPGIHE